jgi:ubiquitin-protein ligase E3 C
MFNFTGSSRPRRNINLSGRKTTTPATGNLWNKSSTSSSLQAAREERAAREAERRRLKAVAAIQRTWRGRKAAERQRKEWRAAWDRMVGGEFRGDDIPNIVSLFLGFTEMGRQKRRAMWDEDNLARLGGGVAIVSRWVQENSLGQTQDLDRTTALHGRFARLLVDAVDCSIVPDDILEQTYRLLSLFGEQYPIIIGEDYYSALSKATAARRPFCTELVEAVVSPLQARGAAVDGAFKAFTARYLTTPNLVSLLGEDCAEKLVTGVNLQRLSTSFSPGMDKLEIDQKLWLLAHVVYLSTHGKRVIDLTDETSSTFSAEKEQYLGFLSRLLSSVAVEVGQRIDIEDISMNDEDDSEDGGTFSIGRRKTQKEPLPPFVKEQIQSLVQQRSISSLLASTKSTDGNVQVLAAFALTLLLVFPARRTDMRFWLCVANTADDVPAVKYVWSAMKRCTLFDIIKADANNAVNKLKYPPRINGMSAQDVEDQWNLVFLFLEMYSFILVTADDHEFLQGRGRQLPLDEVKELTVFLKNLSFAMHWWIGEIMGEDKTKDNGGEVFFQTLETGRAWELGYFRNVVTDVLKALYTREYVYQFPISLLYQLKPCTVLVDISFQPIIG